MSTEGQLKLSYSDGRVPTQGVERVNEVLKTIGVRVSTVSLPEQAKPILEISKKRAITKEESEKLISLFSMHRGDLLEQIKKAGRVPEAHRGGFLSTSEVGVAPYPKVYDMNAAIFMWQTRSIISYDNLISNNTVLFEMPVDRSIDIDNQTDWDFVEFMMSKRLG